MEQRVLLEAKNLVQEFPAKNRKKVHAVSNVDLTIYAGETLALVGESGCGKSTLGRTLMNLIPPVSGTITFEGVEITKLSKKEFAPYRKQMQLIFQDPYASLDPRMTVRDIIAEPLEIHKVYPDKESTTQKVKELLQQVGVPEEFIYRYPHQFSGGQRQRIGIARAIALNPKLIICDEPVSALDVSVQSQVLNLMKDLQKEFGLTYLFISHDLSVVKFMADRVAVMFLGKLCEIADTDSLYAKPLHPYTRFLLDAIPKADPRNRGRNKQLLQGEIPSPIDVPGGCRFHTRCPFATDRCKSEEPKMRQVEGHMVACHFAEDLAK